MPRFRAIFLVACVAFSACGKDVPAPTTTAASSTERGARIVSTVPAATLNLVLIGAADRLVGVSTFDKDYLPAAQKDLPVVGDHETMNYEQLVSLHPTALVIQTIPARIPPRLKEVTAAHHIEILNMKFDHVSDIWDSVRVLAKAAGREAAAAEAIAAAQADLKDLAAQYKDVPHPKVVFMTDSSTIAGAGSFIDEIITTAGGDNVGRQVGEQYPTIDNEWLARLMPDVLLISAPGERPAMKDDPRLAPYLKLPMPAARSGRVYLVTDPSALDASVAIGKNVRSLAALIHGETLPSPDHEGATLPAGARGVPLQTVPGAGGSP